MLHFGALLRIDLAFNPRGTGTVAKLLSSPSSSCSRVQPGTRMSAFIRSEGVVYHFLMQTKLIYFLSDQLTVT